MYFWVGPSWFVYLSSTYRVPAPPILLMFKPAPSLHLRLQELYASNPGHFTITAIFWLGAITMDLTGEMVCLLTLLTRPRLRIIAAELTAVIKVLPSFPFVFQARGFSLALPVAYLASLLVIDEAIINVINVLIAPLLDPFMLQEQGTCCSGKLEALEPTWVVVDVTCHVQ